MYTTRGHCGYFSPCPLFVGETQVLVNEDKSTKNKKKGQVGHKKKKERKKLYIVSTRCLMSTDGVCLHERVVG